MSFAIGSRFTLRSRDFINCVSNNLKRWNSTSTTVSGKSYKKEVFTGLGVGVLIGGGYAFYTLKYDFPTNQTISIDDAQLQKSVTSVASLPNVEFARQVSFSSFLLFVNILPLSGRKFIMYLLNNFLKFVLCR